MSPLAICLLFGVIANASAINLRTRSSNIHEATAGAYGHRTMSELMFRLNQTMAASAVTRNTEAPAGALLADIQVMYGVFTSKGDTFQRKLEAQLDTWAQQPAKEGRFLALGGRDYPRESLVPGLVEAVDCTDSYGGLSCREAHLIAEGAKRGVDWIFIIGEDNYIDTAMLENKLRSYRPDDFKGLGCIGCGKDIQAFGDAVSTKGSFCGGCGYALSKQTLIKLTENGLDNLISEYGSTEMQNMPNDMNTGHAIWKRGGELEPFPGELGAGPTINKKSFRTYVHNNVVVYHYMTPLQMRWLHSVKKQDAEEHIARWEELTFDEVGCTRDIESVGFAQHVIDCKDAKGIYGP
jgi:hypothetical protein